MLEDYFSILARETGARHWVASRTPAGVPSLDGLAEKELWGLHDAAMETWRKAWRERTPPEPSAGPSLLELKSVLADRMLGSCHMCERRCGANRAAGETGWCGVGAVPRVASNFLHLENIPQ